MERKEALKLGLKKYKTGRPCKHGHLVERYSESGACSSCVSNLVTFSSEKSAAARAEIDRVTSKIYIFLTSDGFAALKIIVDGMIGEKHPNLNADSVNPYPFDGVAVGSDMFRVAIRVPTEDVDSAYSAGKLLATSGIDGEKERRRVLGHAADVPMAPIPDWARISKPGDFDYKGE